MSIHRILDDLSGALASLGAYDSGASDGRGTRAALRLAEGSTTPTAGKAGYAKGCIFIDKTNAILYFNTGTEASSTWTVLSPNGTLAVSAVDGLTIGGVIAPQHLEVSFHGQAAADMVDQSFFIANRAYQVRNVTFLHAVAETTAASLDIQVTKDTSTNAPGAGTDLLTNNTNAGFDGRATANTLQTGTLTATVASLQMAAGDRLSVDFEAAATELVGVTITVSLIRI